MELAMKKAKEVGVAWVTCTGKWGMVGVHGMGYMHAWHESYARVSGRSKSHARVMG